MEKQILGQIPGNCSHWHNPCDSARVSAPVGGNFIEFRAKITALGRAAHCPPEALSGFFLNLFDSKFKRSYFDSLTFYFPQMKMLPGDQSPLKRCFLKTHFYISNQVKNGGFSLTLESCLTVKVSFKEDLALIFQGLLIHIHKTKHGLWKRAPAIRVPSFCYLLIASPWEVP